jgi:methanogenic corrinoid protein MtbC1
VTAPAPSDRGTADPRPTGAAGVDAVADEFFDALHRTDEGHAVALAGGLLDGGVPAQDVLLGLVAPAQQRIGLLWQTGAWSVAEEHAATCINERVVAAVGTRTRHAGRRGHVVVGCLDGEWHALAARIVAEVLRLHDWRVTFLGASVPPAHLVSFLHQHGPDVVALSAALPIHLPAAHRTIVAAQRIGTPVLVGGPGFGRDGRWARRLGADAWAPTAADAVALLDRRPWPEPEPHDLSDDGAEYAGIRQRRGRLMAAGAQRLRDLVRRGPGAAGGPAPAALTDAPLDDDLEHVVDFLAAAAYLHDPEPFTDHLGWLAAVATSRGAPAAALHAVLDALRAQLHDFPFALGCLDDGHAVLDRAGFRR